MRRSGMSLLAIPRGDTHLDVTGKQTVKIQRFITFPSHFVNVIFLMNLVNPIMTLYS